MHINDITKENAKYEAMNNKSHSNYKVVQAKQNFYTMCCNRTLINQLAINLNPQESQLVKIQYSSQFEKVSKAQSNWRLGNNKVIKKQNQ